MGARGPRLLCRLGLLLLMAARCAAPAPPPIGNGSQPDALALLRWATTAEGRQAELQECHCPDCTHCERRPIRGSSVVPRPYTGRWEAKALERSGAVLKALIIGPGKVEGFATRMGKAQYFGLERVVRVRDPAYLTAAVGEAAAQQLTYGGALPWYPPRADRCAARLPTDRCVSPTAIPGPYQDVLPALQRVLAEAAGQIRGQAVLVVGCPWACWLVAELQRHSPSAVAVVSDTPCPVSSSPGGPPVSVLPNSSVSAGAYALAVVLSGVEDAGLPCSALPAAPADAAAAADRRLLAFVRGRLSGSAATLLLSVPVGQDALFLRAHRQYGPRTLPLLLRGWAVAAAHGLTASAVWMANRDPAVQRRGLFVLRPLAQEPPAGLTARQLMADPDTGLLRIPGLDTPIHTAAIVEVRKSVLLLRIVKHHLCVLPPTCRIHIFHSGENARHLMDNFRGAIAAGRVKLTKICESASPHRAWYNLLLVTAPFWEQIEGENVLVFQTDSAVCSNSRQDIYDFVNWDFVGAVGPNFADRGYLQPHQNGGFSFRKRSKMLEAIAAFKPQWDALYQHYNFYNEDYFFTRFAEAIVMKAPVLLASNFSCDNRWHPSPFAYHKSWRNKVNWQKRCTYSCSFQLACPELLRIHRRSCGPCDAAVQRSPVAPILQRCPHRYPQRTLVNGTG
eukprot:EG_transcript_4854